MSEPIWKDRIVVLGSYATTNFRIKVGTRTIYSGTSHKRPGESQNSIKINDICADYLQNVLPTLSQAEFTALGSATFKTEAYYLNAWHEVDSVEFINDWSYDYDHDPAVDGIAFPITRRVDARQWLIYSAYDADIIAAHIILKSGDSLSIYVPTLLSNDFNADFNEDFSKVLRGSKNGTALLDLSQYDAEAVDINGQIYEVVPPCHRFALYYANAYGGWDSLLMEGNYKIQDNLTRHQRDLEYNNSSITNRGKDNYLNEITRSITLNTSWLTDEESLRMPNLLNSNNVFLMDLETQQMIPVILANTTTEHKTYKSNGKQLVNYQIEVSIAQTMIRR